MARRESPPGRIRIIGGAFRGRRIPVPDKPGLRPTPDRVRETLFNWLQARLPGSACLDLFAGSGALSLESASRGAARVVAVERDRVLARSVQRLAAEWQATALTCVEQDALSWLQGVPEAFDVVFLDPPYQSGLARSALDALTAGGWLSADALVYLEHDAGTAMSLPQGFVAWREARAGQVAFGLYRWTAA